MKNGRFIKYNEDYDRLIIPKPVKHPSLTNVGAISLLDSFINLPMYSAPEPKSMELIGPTGEGFGYTAYKGMFTEEDFFILFTD